ncbi:hypothetical protein FOL47_003527 [Perkinsus chesapeaki]|uniref:Tyrosine specific protein phosphatases domain-containing protein n=1 Tax=Perkinsus chesapeaki TaxID=330153 RepID=A0A7J6N025_PERCH|nr:hypothetical protein FOL47_003527 [Perkinsus chesapeaki]
MGGVWLRNAAVAGVALFLAWKGRYSSKWQLVILLWIGVVHTTTAFLNATQLYPGFPGKSRTTGALNPLRTVLLWPFFLFQWCYVATAFLVQLSLSGGWNPGDSYAEVAPGLFVGDIMASAFDRQWDAVLDVTNELPRLSSSRDYHCIPTWDGTAPTVAQLDEACNYIQPLLKKDKSNNHNERVLIHCAHGKGRSVTVMTAVLVGLGIEPDWRSAYNTVTSATGSSQWGYAEKARELGAGQTPKDMSDLKRAANLEVIAALPLGVISAIAPSSLAIPQTDLLTSPKGSKRPRSATESSGKVFDDASSDDGGLDGLMGLAFDDDLAAGLDDTSGMDDEEEEALLFGEDLSAADDAIEPEVLWTSPRLLDRYTLCVVQDGGAEHTVPMSWYRERSPGDASKFSKETPDSPRAATNVLPTPIPEVPINMPGKYDPRFIEVCDHDGRESQFQHWLEHGCIWKTGLVCTMDQEHSRPSCLQPNSSRAAAAAIGGGPFSPNGLRSGGSPRSTRASPANAGGDSTLARALAAVNAGGPGGGQSNQAITQHLLQQLRAVTSAATAAAKRSAHPMPVATSEREKSHQMRRDWDKQVNKLGKQLMVAMGYRELDRENRLNEWCAWLGVKLTYIGLSNNSYSKLPGVVPTGAVGDIDLCGNGLEDAHLHVLASTLKPFNRLRVKVLRLSQNNISDGGLELLLSYPYMQTLHLDRNKLTGGQRLLHFIVNAVAQLRETRHSQSDREWRSLPPLWINLGGNYIQDATELIRQLTGDQYGLVVCHPERTGCEPSAMCRVYGERCDVHLECLGHQRPIEDIKYHESLRAAEAARAAGPPPPPGAGSDTVIDVSSGGGVADIVDLEDDD